MLVQSVLLSSTESLILGFAIMLQSGTPVEVRLCVNARALLRYALLKSLGNCFSLACREQKGMKVLDDDSIFDS